MDRGLRQSIVGGPENLATVRERREVVLIGRFLGCPSGSETIGYFIDKMLKPRPRG
jgi:hypothetical protein